MIPTPFSLGCSWELHPENQWCYWLTSHDTEHLAVRHLWDQVWTNSLGYFSSVWGTSTLPPSTTMWKSSWPLIFEVFLVSMQILEDTVNGILARQQKSLRGRGNLNQHLSFGGSFGLPRWLSHKESTCQCRRHKTREFNPWVRKNPLRRACQPTRVFLPGKTHG